MWTPPFPLWSLREDVHLEVETPDEVVLHHRWADSRLPLPRPSVLSGLQRMTLGPISLDNLGLSPAEHAELADILDALPQLVVRSFGIEPAVPLVSVVPLTPDARFRLPTGPVTGPVRLSRFALLRTEGNRCLVESPLSLHRVVLHQPAGLAAIAPLMRPVTPEDLDEPSRFLMAYLLAAGLAVEATGESLVQGPRFPEDSDPALVAWNPVELMFFTRSTTGRHDHDFGAIYPMGDHWYVEPVVKAPSGKTYLPLPRPRWQDLVAGDPPVTMVVEGNQPAQRYAGQTLTARELGELLYRAARVRSLTGSPMEVPTTLGSDRPYPSSGDCYELELYATVDRCADVPRGVYHYDPYFHRLESVDADPTDVDQMLAVGTVAASLDGPPPVLLTITARFRRLLWKYNGLSFLLAMKNVGVLTHTISLVGTAMGLTTCGIDGGDLDLPTRVFGVDWRVESSLGGLAVGRRVAYDKTDELAQTPVNDPDWAENARATLPGAVRPVAP